MAHHDWRRHARAKRGICDRIIRTGGRFSLKGTVNGNVLTFEYQEAEAREDARFTLKGSGNAFTGRFQIRNGRRVGWDGWRPDPKAPADKLGVFAGLVLTDFGYSRLSQDDWKIHGRYAIRGDSTMEGPAKGHRLDFRFKSFRNEQGWFDLAFDRKSLAGAANNSDFPG